MSAERSAGAAFDFDVDHMRDNAAAGLAAGRRGAFSPARATAPPTDSLPVEVETDNAADLAVELHRLNEAERRLAQEADAAEQRQDTDSSAESTPAEPDQPAEPSAAAAAPPSRPDQQRPVNILEFLYDPQAEEIARRTPDEDGQKEAFSSASQPPEHSVPPSESSPPSPAWRDEPSFAETESARRDEDDSQSAEPPAEPPGQDETPSPAAESGKDEDYSDLREFLEQAEKEPDNGDSSKGAGKDSAGLKGLIRKVFTK